MPRTEITGDQVRDGTLTGEDIEDGGIYRQDLNITSTGKAVVRKVTTSTGLSYTYTGVDAGTGDVILTVSTGYVAVVHRPLDQLVHNIAETAYYEITRSGTQISKETWWTTAGKTIKIREIDYTYSGAFVSQIVTKQYDILGNLIIGETLTEIITRTGVNIGHVTAVLS